MIHTEYTWKNADGISLFGQSWMPDNPPRAVINYVHGFKDHSSRFEKWALRLNANGYGVIAADLRGHGRSDGPRGCAASFMAYVKDVLVLRTKAEEFYGSIPHILYGHSLGGNIVAHYLIRETLLPKAAVISSPWFSLAQKPSPLKLAFAKLAQTFTPGLSFRSDLDPRYLSHDPSVVEQYISDPLVHNAIQPRLFFDIEKYGKLASHCIFKINLPLLVMHGSDDRITSVKQTRNFVMNAGSQTTYREWPGAYHELHNDTTAEAVFHCLLQWLERQTR